MLRCMVKYTAMNEDTDIATRVAEQEAEIIRYKGVLQRYIDSPSRTNRWYNSGKEHLEMLEAELDSLKKLIDTDN